MSTRKLIITAFLCGMAILLAGGLKLFLTATDLVEAEVLPLGTSATLGDMTVRVDSLVESAGLTVVTVTMSGVEGADATAGWRLLAGGKVHEPVALVDGPDGSATPCTTTTAANDRPCAVAFEVADGSPTVAYIRAGGQRQWAP